MNPAHGRVLIYVWAVEQDSLSKRTVPPGEQDVFVPWVRAEDGAVFKRYYHMFRAGELMELVSNAAGELELKVDMKEEGTSGVEVVREGWERSNWYVELRRWEAA